jgi:hypothetical protein
MLVISGVRCMPIDRQRKPGLKVQCRKVPNTASGTAGWRRSDHSLIGRQRENLSADLPASETVTDAVDWVPSRRFPGSSHTPST